MSTIINGDSPSVTFSDSTTQSTAFTGKALSASPYTTQLGAGSLANNTGASNTAIGNGALASNTTASNNTAVGYQAGYSNTTGSGENTFIGRSSGYSNTGAYNTFVGSYSGYYATSGTNNTFVGPSGTYAAGLNMTTGSKNTILGAFSGNNGGLDIRTSGNNIVISDGDGTPGFYYTSSASAWYLPATYNVATASAANMVIFSGGLMARSTSALKYKTDIRDLPSIDVNKFRPIVYKSKGELDDQTKDHFGIIADEVDEAGIKELVTYNDAGEVEGFQYERLTVVLLKELQELNAKVEAQALEIATQNTKITELEAKLKV